MQIVGQEMQICNKKYKNSAKNLVSGKTPGQKRGILPQQKKLIFASKNKKNCWENRGKREKHHKIWKKNSETKQKKDKKGGCVSPPPIQKPLSQKNTKSNMCNNIQKNNK